MLERTHHMRDSSEMQADPFSDILKFTRAASLVTGGFSAGGAWAVRFPAPDKIKFFAVVKGQCWVRIDGHGKTFLFETVPGGRPRFAPVEAMRVSSEAGRSTAKLGRGDDFRHIGGHVLPDPVSGLL